MSLNQFDLQHLESRQLFSTVALGTDGTLTINGTTGNDNIYVTTSTGNVINVMDNYVSKGTYSKTAVKKIVVNLMAGNDYAAIGLYEAIPCKIDGGDGADTLSAGYGNSTLLGGNGDDKLTGSKGNDSLVGGAGNDGLTGGEGNDSMNAGDGADLLIGQGGNDTMDGGLGADRFRGGAGGDTVTYASRTTAITVDITDSPTETPDDGAVGEKDFVEVDCETIIGGAGNDKITGTVYPSTNTTAGLTKNNKLVGNGGNDTLIGLDGNDSLDGGAGNDSMTGGDGNDNVNGGTGTDRMYGNAGIDTADYSGRTTGVYVDLDGIADDGDKVIGEKDLVWNDFENITGGNGNDWLVGNGLNNVVRGNAGNDTLEGSSGNDTLYGDAGVDKLMGESGDDTMYARKPSTGTVADNDIVDGGIGTDKAQVDSTDVKASIETLLA